MEIEGRGTTPVDRALDTWTCLMIDDLPTWIPPRWVDRKQRPLRNARVLARQQGLGLRC